MAEKLKRESLNPFFGAKREKPYPLNDKNEKMVRPESLENQDIIPENFIEKLKTKGIKKPQEVYEKFMEAIKETLLEDEDVLLKGIGAICTEEFKRVQIDKTKVPSTWKKLQFYFSTKLRMELKNNK